MRIGGVVLVTGVGQGFGRTVALGLGHRGYDVVCADRDVALASKTAAEVEEDERGQAIPIQIDVAVPMDVRHAFEKVDALFGRIDGVVHIASRRSGTPATEVTDGELAELMDETLRSSFLLLKHAAKRIDRGFVVIVTPPADAEAAQNELVRQGLVGLVRGFARSADHLRINAVTPSRIASDPLHDARVTEAVAFLAGGASEGISGGGLTVQLPPPPRVTMSLLPEIRAALDDRVRQDDLESYAYDPFGSGSDDDDLGDDADDDDDDVNGDDELEDEELAGDDGWYDLDEPGSGPSRARPPRNGPKP